MQRNPESISALFPAYNDASTIGSLVEETVELLRTTGRDFEVIVVDDGSQDATAAVLEECQKHHPGKVRVIRHAVNRGYGAALRSGFHAAVKDLVFYTDGDGQYDPNELPRLLKRLRPSTGMVNGYKIKRRDPLYRILIGKVYNTTIRLLFGIRVRDVDCDFRLIRRDWLQRLNLRSDSGVICLELVLALETLGCPIEEVAVPHYPRIAGRSQFFRWRSLLSTLGQLLHLLYRKRIAGTPSAERVAHSATD